MARKRGFNRRRKINNREQNPSYLILTEDEKSSLDYINGLLRFLGHNPRRFSPQSPGSSPKNIRLYAKKSIKNHEFIFCVFDRDSHDAKGNTYTDLIEWIKTQDTVLCVNSVPCFEYWLYLHFEDYTAPLETSDKTERLLKTKVPDYCKSRVGFDAYKEGLDDAKRHAARSVVRFEADQGDDPMTRMGEFIEFLDKLPRK